MSYKLNERQTYSGKTLKINRYDYSDRNKFLLAGFLACCAMVIALAWSIA